MSDITYTIFPDIKMIFRLGLYILAAAVSTVNPTNIYGYATTIHTTKGIWACNNIQVNTCCSFSRGDLQSSSSNLCGGISRDACAGPARSICLSGGILSNYFGGGAAWFDCLHCAAEDSSVARSDEISSKSCTSTAIPTMFAWERDGVWVLEFQEGDAWDRYNELPVTTDFTDTCKYDVHLENLKSFGATWYKNAEDHPVAAEMLLEV
ncbi:hypothetical protein BDV38DRAFT_153396 [Aspergillus pseudotamarii]|uniref:Uncharacterized protein n=1 Tax=Aspergillus pseudotamarii TaxID=132259 RepID=A0A5N6T7H8_ASPPS|nr:uncharacterized protein BDV38DRAFT_153396 [Aspergillus pseudotamarii]KAE8142328.1 hypothetical protein BDV38DRAFT_153396 [Aspergillus pseudotamarii]